MQHISGECSVVGTAPLSSAFGLILPAGQASPYPRCPSPEHLPQLSVLGGAGEAEIFLLPLTELEGPLPVPSRPCPVGSLERTYQHPVEGASFPSPASSVMP